MIARLFEMRGCSHPHTTSLCIERHILILITIRPEKRHLAAISGIPGASGAGRESPIGDDDNEEVRQRAKSRPPLSYNLRLTTLNIRVFHP